MDAWRIFRGVDQKSRTGLRGVDQKSFIIHIFSKMYISGTSAFIYILERFTVRNPLIVETSFIRNRIYKISVQLMKTRIGHKLITKLMNKWDLKIYGSVVASYTVWYSYAQLTVMYYQDCHKTMKSVFFIFNEMAKWSSNNPQNWFGQLLVDFRRKWDGYQRFPVYQQGFWDVQHLWLLKHKWNS